VRPAFPKLSAADLDILAGLWGRQQSASRAVKAVTAGRADDAAGLRSVADRSRSGIEPGTRNLVITKTEVDILHYICLAWFGLRRAGAMRAQHHLADLPFLPPGTGHGRDLFHPLRDLAFVEVVH
jgi:hypothetical protein